MFILMICLAIVIIIGVGLFLLKRKKSENKKLLQTNIISLLGLESLSEERKTKLLEKLADLVFKQAMVRVMEKLSEADQAKLSKLIDAGDTDKTNAFIVGKVPNFEKIMNEEIVKVKKEMIKETENV